MKIGTLRLIGAWHAWRAAVWSARFEQAKSLGGYHLQMANAIAAEYSRRIVKPEAAKDEAAAAIATAKKPWSKWNPDL